MLPQVDPKDTFWFGVWTNILILIAGYGVTHAPSYVAHYAPDVQWFAGLFAQINGLVLTALAGISSSQAGPLIRLPSVDATKTVARILIAAFVLSFLLSASPATAETRRPAQQGPVLTGDLIQDAKNDFKGDPNAPGAIQLTGNLKKDAQAIWDKIVAASDKDLSYASQLAANANTPSSLVRKQCWDAILATNQQANGLNLKDSSGNVIAAPDPKLFTQIEQAAEVLDALSPQGKLFTSCAGAAQLAQTGVLQFISAALTGVAGIAKLTPITGL